jgi:hypothetical protein
MQYGKTTDLSQIITDKLYHIVYHPFKDIILSFGLKLNQNKVKIAWDLV